MKKYSIIPKIAILTWSLLFTITSCVRPDLSDCGTTRLLVKFDPQMFDLPENEHRIEKVHIFFFDQNHTYIDSWQGGAYDYLSGPDYVVPVNLAPGNYTCIAWTNTGEPFHTAPGMNEIKPQVTTMEEVVLNLDDAQGNRYPEDIPDLHYGINRRILVDAAENNDYTIYLIPDTYRLHLSVKGLKMNEDEFEFVIEDNNSHFNFENSIVADGGNVQHIRTSPMNGDHISASMRVLSLTDDHAIENIGQPGSADRSPQFTFSNRTTGQQLYSDDLVKMIRTAYRTSGNEVDFDKLYKFSITLSFDADLNVTVTVDGWTYNPNEIEL